MNINITAIIITAIICATIAYISTHPNKENKEKTKEDERRER